jgi:hypothetical protein
MRMLNNNIQTDAQKLTKERKVKSKTWKQANSKTLFY